MQLVFEKFRADNAVICAAKSLPPAGMVPTKTHFLQEWRATNELRTLLSDPECPVDECGMKTANKYFYLHDNVRARRGKDGY
jgi:hypothetical protein